MMTTNNSLLIKHFYELLRCVPFKVKLDYEDFGFLFLMAVCKMNGFRIEGQNIYHGEMLVGHQLNYRFDGHVLQFAYFSNLENKLISSSIRVV